MPIESKCSVDLEKAYVYWGAARLLGAEAVTQATWSLYNLSESCDHK